MRWGEERSSDSNMKVGIYKGKSERGGLGEVFFSHELLAHYYSNFFQLLFILSLIGSDI